MKLKKEDIRVGAQISNEEVRLNFDNASNFREKINT
jgi:hypothetical protein